SFCKSFPEVEVEIAASEELVDLASHGFDAGIRLGQFIAADMVTVRLTPSFPLVVVASPAYLRAHKAPKKIEDVHRHACLRMRRSNGAIAPWSFVEGNKTIEAAVAGPLVSNNYPTLLGSAIEGMGLAQIPEPVAAAAIRAGKLSRVLDAFVPTVP